MLPLPDVLLGATLRGEADPAALYEVGIGTGPGRPVGVRLVLTL